MELPPQSEPEAWEAVVARWADESAHRAYLARFTDLDGLAVAGRRYREALAARPADPVASRWRDEVVRRAMAQGLAQIPRARPPRALPRWARLALALAVSVVLSALGWIAVARWLAVSAEAAR